ncbi:MAG TPA: DUF302 domain-containing protein [Vicinamibacteria bacterium]|nr:DUF302 domain-containing protein [Vicinamibacteria bacterium]
MEHTSLAHKIEIRVPYEDAVEKVMDALKHQGFGVLTAIDVKDTLERKLSVTFRKYVILGACNPPLAERALRAELDVGVLLPCNVVVYETHPGRSAVAAMAPVSAMGLMGDNAAIKEVAAEADLRLREALASLEREHGK